ncbi:MAG TPA: NAD(P)/FAD-dependent oxidoreductase [Xanthobacteraceae bacterium]|nr:NAD(P)/FAD-dependent oxidoreductase [Xanthobacteraceae bacterium]
MKRLNRRSFLAASAAMSATMSGAPAFAAPVTSAAAPTSKRSTPAPQTPSRPGTVDVVIVGAGAAGIAAARRLVSVGRRFALVEAAATVGGRCITDTATFGVPFDRGAHWIHMPDINPVAKLATQTGLDLYPAPPGQRVRIGRRYAREGEMEDYLGGVVRAATAIADASRKSDLPCAQALPKDLGGWRPMIEFVLGPFGCGKDLSEVSAADFARSAERDSDLLCRQGFGALLAKLAGGIPVELSNPVTRISWGARGGGVDVETARGQFEARAAIITVSTNVLSAGKIKFTPDLPKRQLDAAARLKLGSYDHVALELPGNPFGLRPDELVFEKADSNRTAALFANVSGTSLCIVDLGGSFGRDLAAKGDDAMFDFAQTWLGGLYGTDVAKVVKRRHATHWNDEPWIMGAFSAAAPGGQPSRKVLMESVNDRIWFAGEAAHETLWGTAGGAWESGERAADAVVKSLGRKPG